MARTPHKALLHFEMNGRMHICYGLFLPTTTVQELKQYLMENWPRDRFLIPENVKEIILRFDGKLLKDKWTVYRSRLLSNDIIRIHVTVQPAPPSNVTVQPPPPSYVRAIMPPPQVMAMLQFLRNDDTPICDGLFLPTTTVQELKQYLMEMWPREQSVIPKNVKEIKLIFKAEFLEDKWTLYGSRVLCGDIIPCRTVTIHVVVHPLPPSNMRGSRSCTIL